MFSYTSGFRPAESGLLRFDPEVCQPLLVNVYAVKSGDYMNSLGIRLYPALREKACMHALLRS